MVASANQDKIAVETMADTCKEKVQRPNKEKWTGTDKPQAGWAGKQRKQGRPRRREYRREILGSDCSARFVYIHVRPSQEVNSILTSGNAQTNNA